MMVRQARVTRQAQQQLPEPDMGTEPVGRRLQMSSGPGSLGRLGRQARQQACEGERRCETTTLQAPAYSLYDMGLTSQQAMQTRHAPLSSSIGQPLAGAGRPGPSSYGMTRLAIHWEKERHRALGGRWRVDCPRLHDRTRAGH